MKMADGPSKPRDDCERKSGTRRRKVIMHTDDFKKENSDVEKQQGINAEVEVGGLGVKSELPECAVCLQTCVYPAKLPCSHIFCYLCLKGIASQSRRCALCRQHIPQDYLEHPDLVQLPDVLSAVTDSSKCDAVNSQDPVDYQWFYEGRNGWWQYDERTSNELESSYKQGDRNCELLIAGFLYVADFNSMMQIRKNEPSRYRRIKRDLATIARKGIAGLRKFATSTDDLIEQLAGISVSSQSELCAVNSESEQQSQDRHSADSV